MSELQPSPPALEVARLVAGYGKKIVLNDVSLTVTAGQTFGLIGLNGVGKTTLIKTVLSLRDPVSGEIRIFGMERGAKEARARLSYLPERFDPPWFLKGGEFIEFSASLYRRKVTRQVMENTCAALALDPAVLANKVQTYSKGMRQKLGLAATILTGCDMLILDEPMSGLDPLARSLVKDLLHQVRREGRTVILSSHILSDMDEICDQVAVTHGGVMHFYGTPAELREQMGNESLEKSFLKLIKVAA